MDKIACAEPIGGVKASDVRRSTRALQSAFEEACGHDGLSPVWFPVYCGSHDPGGMDVFGDLHVAT